jgi:hypothetical protein
MARPRSVLLHGERILRIEQGFNATANNNPTPSLFGTTAAIPRILVRDALSLSSHIVNTTTGVFDMRTLSRDATSIPFALGMRKSKTTRSGLRASALRIASSPSAASQTSNRVLASMKVRTAFLTEASSSAMRMRLGRQGQDKAFLGQGDHKSTSLGSLSMPHGTRAEGQN